MGNARNTDTTYVLKVAVIVALALSTLGIVLAIMLYSQPAAAFGRTDYVCMQQCLEAGSHYDYCRHICTY